MTGDLTRVLETCTLDVHMPSVMPISDFRKKIFDAADWILKTNQPIDVQRNGQTIFRVTPVSEEETPAQKAEYLLKYVMPKLAGIWKDVPQSEFDKIYEYTRGKKAIAYNKKLRRKWTK